MKTITAYKATDGKIFENEGDCIKHDAELKLNKAIKDFVDKHCYYDMSKSAIEGILLENRKELLEILK